MDTLPRHLLPVLPAFVLLAAIEGWYLQRRNPGGYDWRAYFASMGDVVGRLVFTRLLGLGVAGLFFSIAYRYRITTIAMHAWWAWPLLFVLQDFFYYWMHRADHRFTGSGQRIACITPATATTLRRLIAWDGRRESAVA